MAKKRTDGNYQDIVDWVERKIPKSFDTYDREEELRGDLESLKSILRAGSIRDKEFASRIDEWIDDSWTGAKSSGGGWDPHYDDIIDDIRRKVREIVTRREEETRTSIERTTTPEELERIEIPELPEDVTRVLEREIRERREELIRARARPYTTPRGIIFEISSETERMLSETYGPDWRELDLSTKIIEAAGGTR